MHIRGFFPHFHIDRQIRVVNVDRHRRKRFRQQSADRLTDLYGSHGKLFVRPFRLYFKTFRPRKFPRKTVFRGLCDCFRGFSARRGTGNFYNAKYLTRTGKGGVEITLRALRFRVQGTLAQGNLEGAALAQTAADVCQQTIFKRLPVGPFQHDFP